MSNTIKAVRSQPYVKKGAQDEFKQIKTKVATHAAKVIERFNLGEALAEQIIDCLANRDTQFNEKFSFKFDKPVKGKRIAPSTLTLKEFETPFKFYLGNNTVGKPANCVISFDNNQNVISIVFTFNYLIKGYQFEQSFLTIIYDQKFNLMSFYFEERYYNTQTKRLSSTGLKKDLNMLCSEEDEVFLLNMKFNRNNTMLKEVMPEIHIPSAYDFNSYDYLSRLDMVDMLLV